MPSIPLYPPSESTFPTTNPSSASNPLPQLLHTPSGLAILELQGTIHTSPSSDSSTSSTTVGKLVFPYYSPGAGATDISWMKRVYLYVGKHQRLTGEVKKLPKAMAVVRKRPRCQGDDEMEVEHVGAEKSEELEIVEIVKWKIVFSTRPEPVGGE
jgi:chromosome transmission fidelity protein 8